jgi:DNA adenine methylase
MQSFAQKAKHVKFTHTCFTEIMQQAKLGDIVYCDPPYAPLSTTANFTQYHQQPFTIDHQVELAFWAQQLALQGIPVIISNHDTPYTRKIYKGSRIVKFTARRTISRNIENRKPAKELLAIYE